MCLAISLLNWFQPTVQTFTKKMKVLYSNFHVADRKRRRNLFDFIPFKYFHTCHAVGGANDSPHSLNYQYLHFVGKSVDCFQYTQYRRSMYTMNCVKAKLLIVNAHFFNEFPYLQIFISSKQRCIIMKTIFY